MSTGISQVGFDPKVLEDEEEADYQQEEQQREQEIRNLIINELDDNLLDDENASFSSHDYRSTSNSRASQQLNDSDLQMKEWNSNEYADFPPRRGVFEKPPLMTGRATDFISQTGDKQQQPSGYMNYNQDNQQSRNYETYDQEWEHPSNYMTYNQSTDQLPSGYNQHAHQLPIDYNQPSGQHPSDYNQPSGQHPSSYSHGNNEYQEYEEFGSYHGNSTDTNSNEYDGVTNQNHNKDQLYAANNEHINYGDTYPTDGDGYYGGVQQETSDSYQREASFPGNYRVKYVPGYRPQNTAHADQEQRLQPGSSLQHYSPNTVWRDLRQGTAIEDHDRGTVDNKDNIAEQFVESTERTSNTAQLQILYQARGRKIEELSEKLNEREEELGRQIRVLNHQLVMLKDDHKGVSDSLSQSQEIVKDKQQEIKTIQNKLNIAIKDNELLNKEKQELLDKFNAANSTIDCLNEQLVQLSRADSLAKAREQHETILNTVRQRQEEEILRLKQKLDDSQVALNWKTEEANRLRGEVMEKADIINRLNRTLDDSQRQCQELLKTGTVTEITNLRTQLQDTISAKSKVDLNCTSLKSEINSLKEELVIYQNALKHGYCDQTPESFKGQDIVRNLNSENWATPKTHGNDKQKDAITGLRKELEHSLSLNQTKTQTIKDLENALEEATEKLNEEQKKGERLEKIIVEQEVKVNDLKAQLSDKTAHDDPESDLVNTLQELQDKNQGLKEKLAELEASEQQLSEDNLNLKTQMAEMVAEYDEDKRISLDKCRDACLQLHEDSKEQLRIQLDEEKELALKDLRDALQDSNDELFRVKESYLQLSEEFRNIEKRVREDLKESKDESQAVEAMKTFLEKQHALDIDKARKQWKDEHDVEVKRIVNEETTKIRKQADEEKAREIEKKLQEAKTKWSQRDAIELDNRLSSAKKEWIQEQEQQMIDRISKAVQEARKTWHELQQKNINEQIEKAVDDAKKTLMESRDREISQALSEAKVTWQKEEDEVKQREIEHEIEVAVTNAVAEAKQLWDKTNNEKGRIVHEQQAIESAVALAEVKWLEQEQVKLSRAVDSAVQTAKSSWEHDKQREIARAVAEARHHWQANQDEELNKALEEASAQLVDKFDEEKREAVEMALREAKTLWHRHHDQNNNANIEAIRNELWSEFEDTKRKEFQETIEEERNRFLQEHEKEKQEEINRAIEYLESHYAKGLEEFKHKELRTVLAEARAEWEKEQESEVEEILKKRIDLAREDWFKSLDTSSRTEVDRALATAREAWAAEYEDELEDRVNAEIARIRENLVNEMEDSKRKEIDEAVLTCRKQYESNERKLKDELNRLKVMGPPQSLRRHYENEISKLNLHHQKELERLREEHDEHTRVVRESVEEEFDQKLVAVLHDAKQLWEEEQEEDRIQVEDQHKEKIKSVLENAREQFLKDKEKAVKAATETTTNRQKELLKIEKETHKLTVERMKEELTKTKQIHEEQLQLVERKHAEEMKTLKSALNDRKENGTQTPSNVDSHSICDSSLGSLDQLTAMKTMHELRDSYLDTVAKIRDDVLDHVNQTKTNAAKKIRNEVLKERHSTAKKLRRYYLQCLKQLLEEDKASSDTRKTPSTIEEKLERMNQALIAVSPDSNKVTTQPVTAANETYVNGPNEPNVSSPKEPHITGHKDTRINGSKKPYMNGPKEPYIIGAMKPSDSSPKELYVSSPKEQYITGHNEPHINGPRELHLNGPKEPYILGAKKQHESSPKESYISGRGESYVNVPKELYIVGNKETYISVPSGDRIKAQSRPGGYGPDGASDSPRPSPSDKPQGFRELNNDVISQDITRGSQTVTLWPEKDWTNNTTDHVTLSKPPSVQRRFAGSPALSVTSIESEYTDLPSVSRPSNKTNVATVTPTSPSTSSKTKLDDVKARALARNNEQSVVKPISISATQRGTGTVRNLTNDNRGFKSRDKYIKNNSPLPSRPNVHIKVRTP